MRPMAMTHDTVAGIAAAAAIDGVAADVSGVKITRTFAVDGEWFRRKMEFMGGPGSGQTSARSAAKKTTVEDSLVLTASTLIRQKVLRPWARTAGSWSWRSPRWISRGCAAGRPLSGLEGSQTRRGPSMKAHDVRRLCLCPVCGKVGDDRKMVKVGPMKSLAHDRCVFEQLGEGILNLPKEERAKFTLASVGPDMMRRLVDAA